MNLALKPMIWSRIHVSDATSQLRQSDAILKRSCSSIPLHGEFTGLRRRCSQLSRIRSRSGSYCVPFFGASVFAFGAGAGADDGLEVCAAGLAVFWAAAGVAPI